MEKKGPELVEKEAAIQIDPKSLLSKNLSLLPWWFFGIIFIILWVIYLIFSSYQTTEKLLVRVEGLEITKIEQFVNDPALRLGTELDTSSYGTAALFLPEEQIIGYETYSDAVDDLAAGELDGVIIRRALSGRYLKEHEGEIDLVGRALSLNDTENYFEAFEFIVVGLTITIRVSIFAYMFALIFGLFAGLGRISSNKVMNNVATLYVELIRGIPIIVLIFYIALVGVPTIVEYINGIGSWLVERDIATVGGWLEDLSIRNVPSEWRAIVALSVTYGAFLAEIFRAGIQSIGRGQMEAARSLGMSLRQAMRYVILPQAVRNVLPALANDFVAMVKDSSLVSVLAVGDITQRSRKYTGTSFAFREAFNILSVLYLTMTVTLSLMVRTLERRLRQND